MSEPVQGAGQTQQKLETAVYTRPGVRFWCHLGTRPQRSHLCLTLSSSSPTRPGFTVTTVLFAFPGYSQYLSQGKPLSFHPLSSLSIRVLCVAPTQPVAPRGHLPRQPHPTPAPQPSWLLGIFNTVSNPMQRSNYPQRGIL